MPELFAKLLDLPLGYFLIVIAAILLLVAGVGKFKGLIDLLEPRHSESGCSFGSGFSMQDATGKTYDPGGQLKNGGSFSLVQGQQQRLVATYAFIPSAGSIYTLHPSAINCDYHSIGYTPTYGDAQFTF